MPPLFPIVEYWWLYTSFTGFVLILLGLDLGVFHREAREVKFREALAWCAVWVSLALAFNAGLYGYALWKFPRDARLAAVADFDPAAAAWQVALEFLAGYVVEYSLSVDNIFVFLLVLGYFGVPRAYQHRVLFYGILGALVFRAVFIMLGSVLMQFHWVVWLFGAFLIFTGVKMAVSSAETVKPERNLLIRVVRRFLPVTSGFRGQRFFVKQEGRVWATPLLIALLCLEASDIVFAVDSVPAIFALTASRSSCSARTSSRSWGCARCSSCSAARSNASTCSATGSRWSSSSWASRWSGSTPGTAGSSRSRRRSPSSAPS